MSGKTKVLKVLGHIALTLPPVGMIYAMVECIRAPHTIPGVTPRPPFALY